MDVKTVKSLSNSSMKKFYSIQCPTIILNSFLSCGRKQSFLLFVVSVVIITIKHLLKKNNLLKYWRFFGLIDYINVSNILVQYTISHYQQNFDE